MSGRRNVQAPLREFLNQVGRFRRFDAHNQAVFSAGGRLISKKHLHFLVESIFFSVFKSYEIFIQEVFILYCLEKRPRSGKRVVSYLSPLNFNHAELLIKSSMPFLEWTSPTTVIARSDIYLKSGYPIKNVYTTNLANLTNYKRIRNHIAHGSRESLEEYKKVLKTHFKTVPIDIPSPGEFLLETDKKDKTKYLLLVFFDNLEKIADSVTN